MALKWAPSVWIYLPAPGFPREKFSTKWINKTISIYYIATADMLFVHVQITMALLSYKRFQNNNYLPRLLITYWFWSMFISFIFHPCLNCEEISTQTNSRNIFCLLLQNREAMERLEELETSNNHLLKRLDKLKNAKSALLKDLWQTSNGI